MKDHQHSMNEYSQHNMNTAIGDVEHDHHKMRIADLRMRFYLTLIITIPLMILSPMIQKWFHFNLSFTGSLYLLFSLSSHFFFMEDCLV